MTRRPMSALLLACLLVGGAALPLHAQAPDTELADRFPASLDGRDLDITTRDGAEWMSQFDAADADGATVIERTEALLATVGASLDDLTIATAMHEPSEGNVATISAVRVEGAGAHELVADAIALLLGDVSTPDLEVRFNAGRDVLKVRDAEMPGAYPRTLLPVGDTLFIIEAEPPLLDEILAALPAAPEPATPVFDPAGAMPLVLDGNRRVYLVVSSGWDYVFWQSDNNPSELDVMALQSFLTSGIPMDDVTTTSAVWTDQLGNIGAVVAAYQFAGADQAALDELLASVILPGFEGIGTEHEPGQLAGRDVTVLRDESLTEPDGTPRPVYLYSSGDTVFVLDAPESTAAVAIEALP